VGPPSVAFVGESQGVINIEDGNMGGTLARNADRKIFQDSLSISAKRIFEKRMAPRN